MKEIAKNSLTYMSKLFSASIKYNNMNAMMKIVENQLLKAESSHD